jgi:hypothetical protein
MAPVRCARKESTVFRTIRLGAAVSDVTTAMSLVLDMAIMFLPDFHQGACYSEERSGG